ncbi:MAG: hypothetical protein ACI8WL_000757 [Polaribacter sp.]|jgi:hypothetical protein|tara:strand:+ start:62 stop:298 length:237 start_codon:yes stop_codon:yes gene_type:complete
MQGFILGSCKSLPALTQIQLVLSHFVLETVPMLNILYYFLQVVTLKSFYVIYVSSEPLARLSQIYVGVIHVKLSIQML